jgi:3-methyl-2-oxobutanoate hydroxymethyltransferase
MEGGASIAPTVERVVTCGIPVMAHIGLMPQSVYQLGGWRIQGRDAAAAHRLIDDALALEQAGAFAIVLETIPAPLAKDITKRLHIPTIGIGAGPDCDGQVQVYHDLLGFTEEHLPKHARRYATLAETIREAVSSYVGDVQSGRFPTEENSFQMDEATLAALYGEGHKQ